MEKIKKYNSLKWRIWLYIPLSLILAYLGSFFIGTVSNDVQQWYANSFFEYEDENESLYHILYNYDYEIIGDDHEEQYVKYVDDEGNTRVIALSDLSEKPQKTLVSIGYEIVSYAQAILIPIWVVLCLYVASILFYKREMEGDLNTLLHASEKISNQELEFEITATKKNEIGAVCNSVEKMRESLLATSKEKIRMIEESKRLNAAFAHDIRTPITVMKGYVDLLEKYIPEGKVSQEKELEILGMMHNQVERLENYALSMSSVRKLDDIVPNVKLEDFSMLKEELKNACVIMDERVTFRCDDNEAIMDDHDKREIFVDKELLFEVIENIVSNAIRYAKDKIEVSLKINHEYLEVNVVDDGCGFSEMILKKAGNPYLREDKAENKEHFGLGIYISKMLCVKCGGGLELFNDNGAGVKVFFKIK